MMLTKFKKFTHKHTVFIKFCVRQHRYPTLITATWDAGGSHGGRARQDAASGGSGAAAKGLREREFENENDDRPPHPVSTAETDATSTSLLRFITGRVRQIHCHSGVHREIFHIFFFFNLVVWR